MPYELLDDVAPSKSESTAGLALRTGARTLARGAEAILGLPGDIGKAITQGGTAALNYAAEKATGKSGLFNPAPSSYDFTPTSENIKKNVTKPLSGEYLEPQGDTEKFWDDIVGDAATLLIPAKGKVPSVAKAFGISTAGNVGKWAAESLTDSPLLGAGAKIGAMALAGTVGGRKELNKIREQSYAEAFKKLPSDQKFDFSPERSKIDQMIKVLNKGDKPDKSFLIDRLKSVDNVIGKAQKTKSKVPSIGNVTGELGNVGELIDLKKDWNQHLAEGNLSKAASDVLKIGVGVLNDGIKRYGQTNKAFYKDFSKGEELTAALKSSSLLQRILDKHPVLQKSAKNPLIKNLVFGGASYGFTKLGTPALGGIAAGALAAREGAKAYKLLIKSPEARKYYKDLLLHGSVNNIKAMARDINKLSKVADRFEELSSNRYQLLD